MASAPVHAFISSSSHIRRPCRPARLAAAEFPRPVSGTLPLPSAKRSSQPTGVDENLASSLWSCRDDDNQSHPLGRPCPLAARSSSTEQSHRIDVGRRADQGDAPPGGRVRRRNEAVFWRSHPRKLRWANGRKPTRDELYDRPCLRPPPPGRLIQLARTARQRHSICDGQCRSNVSLPDAAREDDAPARDRGWLWHSPRVARGKTRHAPAAAGRIIPLHGIVGPCLPPGARRSPRHVAGPLRRTGDDRGRDPTTTTWEHYRLRPATMPGSRQYYWNRCGNSDYSMTSNRGDSSSSGNVHFPAVGRLLMARSSLLLDLVRAGARGDHALFRRALEALVTERARQAAPRACRPSGGSSAR